MTICLTKEEPPGVGESGPALAESGGGLAGKLCCLGRVGGGWLGLWAAERLCCFFIGAGVGETGDTTDPVSFRDVWDGKPPEKVLGGARGGPLCC